MVKLGMEGIVEAKIAKHQGMDELKQNDEKTMDSWEPEGIGEHSMGIVMVRSVKKKT